MDDTLGSKAPTGLRLSLSLDVLLLAHAWGIKSGGRFPRPMGHAPMPLSQILPASPVPDKWGRKPMGACALGWCYMTRNARDVSGLVIAMISFIVSFRHQDKFRKTRVIVGLH
ncbi:hypothetical protein MCOR21_003266 [Pyricularia oryzae]|nr:hypothetical protein MCOR21_003266 [Pyricularia oryzae]